MIELAELTDWLSREGFHPVASNSAPHAWEDSGHIRVELAERSQGAGFSGWVQKPDGKLAGMTTSVDAWWLLQTIDGIRAAY